METHFVYKLIKKFGINYDYAKVIYFDLYERNLISEATDDINAMKEFKDFILKYYKENYKYE